MPLADIPLYDVFKLGAILFFMVLTYYLLIRALFSKKLKIITVIDGDTFIGMSIKGKKYRLRLEGLDCPELGQEQGQYAKDQVIPLIEDKWVRAYFKGLDEYKRRLVRIKVNGRDLTCLMLSKGLAYPTNNFSLGYYLARITRKGIFSGKFSTRIQHPKLFKSRNRFRIWLNYKLKSRKSRKSSK